MKLKLIQLLELFKLNRLLPAMFLEKVDNEELRGLLFEGNVPLVPVFDKCSPSS